MIDEVAAMTLELVLMSFEHPEGAEWAFVNVRDEHEDEPWIHELAFVERRRRDRIVVRGTFAGHYVDIEDLSDPLGRDTVIGALTGALIGAAFGPPGFAAGLVAGGAIGGLVQSGHLPELEDELFDQIRAHVPAGASAIALLAAREHVEQMVDAFAGLAGHAYRRVLTDEQAAVLERALASAPLVAAVPDPGGD
jgi:uncharacterized membrane protein